MSRRDRKGARAAAKDRPAKAGGTEKGGQPKAGRPVKSRPAKDGWAVADRPAAGGSMAPDASRASDERAEAPAGEELLAGKHPVLEALRSGRPLNKIWVASQAQRQAVQPILEAARERGVAVQVTDRRALDRLAPGVPHQGVVAQTAAAPYAELEELLERAARSDLPPLLVLLDEVEDPHNLGSVLRTAECAGASGVIVPKRRSAGLTAAVAKASAGAVEYIPVARVTNLAQTIGLLQSRGYWVAGADASAPQDVFAADLTGPLAIVIGSEGKGLSRLVREKCDFLVSVPMFGRIGSLNASVAAAVILYEAVRQRMAKDKADDGKRRGEKAGARGGETSGAQHIDTRGARSGDGDRGQDATGDTGGEGITEEGHAPA
mgnify:CR=1 FL=1